MDYDRDKVDEMVPGAPRLYSETWDSPTIEVHVYDGLRLLCN